MERVIVALHGVDQTIGEGRGLAAQPAILVGLAAGVGCILATRYVNRLDQDS